MSFANKPWLLQGAKSEPLPMIFVLNGIDESICLFDLEGQGRITVEYYNYGISTTKFTDTYDVEPGKSLSIEVEVGGVTEITISGIITSITPGNNIVGLKAQKITSLEYIGGSNLSSVYVRGCPELRTIDLSATSNTNDVALIKNENLLSLTFYSISNLQIDNCLSLRDVRFSGIESPAPIITISGKTSVDFIRYAGDDYPQEDEMKNGISALITSSTAETGTVDCTGLAPVATEEFKAELQALVEGYGWTITF